MVLLGCAESYLTNFQTGKTKQWKINIILLCKCLCMMML